MTTANSGAVFFLGTRAHYQVLTPPNSNHFEDNGNTSTETIYQNHSTHPWQNNDNNSDDFPYIDNTDSLTDSGRKEFDYTDGIKRRFKKNRKQDGSSELILNDNEEQDFNAADLNDTDSENAKKNDKRNRVSIAYLLAILSRRKKTTSREQYLRHLESALNVCTFRDSCRCDECQITRIGLRSRTRGEFTRKKKRDGDNDRKRNEMRLPNASVSDIYQSRYFECDETDDNSASDSDGDEYPNNVHYPSNEQYLSNENGYNENSYECHDDCDHARSPSLEEDGDDDEPAASPAPPAPAEEELPLELAAGAPVFFNHLLNNPITCAIM